MAVFTYGHKMPSTAVSTARVLGHFHRCSVHTSSVDGPRTRPVFRATFTACDHEWGLTLAVYYMRSGFPKIPFLKLSTLLVFSFFVTRDCCCRVCGCQSMLMKPCNRPTLAVDDRLLYYTPASDQLSVLTQHWLGII